MTVRTGDFRLNQIKEFISMMHGMSISNGSELERMIVDRLTRIP